MGQQPCRGGATGGASAVSVEDLLDYLAPLKGTTHAKERRDIVHALLQQTNRFDVRMKRFGSLSKQLHVELGS